MRHTSKVTIVKTFFDYLDIFLLQNVMFAIPEIGIDSFLIVSLDRLQFRVWTQNRVPGRAGS